ncbi:alpha/beta hydrolase [Agrococcus lahaulensis]|uniref:alpha/beta hydrolase n=1 Tax=Agrococcus lahaulensis TaxID=341722 RepID=UPI00047B2A4D|nr:alpha/beta fold hydrolase [Agrococcus lahaulensis]
MSVADGSRAIAIDADAAVWRAGTRGDARPVVVLLHGRGGDERDWTAHFARVPDAVGAVSLRGPLPRGERWQWVGEPEEATGSPSAVAAGILAWLDDELPGRRIALVGWSQGAMMALHVARQEPARVAAVAMVAGFVLGDGAPPSASLAALPVWFGIGDADDVIPAGSVAAAIDWLRAHAVLQERTYSGVGHELPSDMASDALAFAARHLGAGSGTG